MKDKNKSLYYSSQAFYWIAYMAIAAYTVVFLKSYDFTYTQIGLVISIANIIACVLQPLVATYLSRPKSPQVKNVLIGYIVLSLLVLIFIFTLQLSKAFMTISYITIYTSALTIQPLYNSITIHLINTGHKGIDFGSSRGIGSFTYAISSIILGVMLEKTNVKAIPVAAFIAYVLTLLTLIKAKVPDEDKILPKEAVIKSKFTLEKYLSFIMYHKKFFIVFFASLFTFTYYYSLNQYVLNIGEMLGGNQANLGTALAINAFAEVPTLLYFKKIIKKIKIEKILVISSIFFYVKGLIYLLGKGMIFFYGAQLFQSISFALYLPAVTMYATSIMDKKNNLIAQSLLTTSFTIGGVLGSYLGGLLIDVVGIKNTIIYLMPIAIIGSFLILLSTSNFSKKTSIYK